ncbi:MAG: class I SAM-dependent methyltransferase [Cyanobacteriota bacterium]|nr:class I SAM-dependent methyltransferase [Cyanobacteriota bacterium]
MTNKYIHGYTTEEQQRLLDQAKYWKDKLILRNLDLSADRYLLEIGCGVGAVLGEIGQAFPGISLAGIDIQEEQVKYTISYLNKLNLENVDVRVGDAAYLPWKDGTFDAIFAIWVLEHLSNQEAVLQETYRVLKPGGFIRLNETDYKTLLIWPSSSDYDYLQDAFCQLFYYSGGHPHIGRRLEPLLSSNGFCDIQVNPIGFYYSACSNECQDLREFVNYVSSFIEPTIQQMVQALGKDEKRLQAGLQAFKETVNYVDGVATAVVYQASAKR